MKDAQHGLSTAIKIYNLLARLVCMKKAGHGSKICIGYVACCLNSEFAHVCKIMRVVTVVVCACVCIV